MHKATYCIIPTENRRVERSKPSCHRRYEPSYDKPMVNIPIARRIDGILKKWDPNKCDQIKKLRRDGGSILMRVYNDGTKRYKSILPRRLTIRLEREQTIRHLLRAIFNNVEYSPNATWLYECMSSIEELAKMIGQLHEYQACYDVVDGKKTQYRHGRKAYDCVLGALEDLEAAGLILVVRGWDPEVKQYKASRIFLQPNLFKSLGMSAKETRYLLAGKAKSDKANGKVFKRSRPFSDKMATINNAKLTSIMNYNRRWFKGEFEDLALKDKEKQRLELLEKFTPSNKEIPKKSETERQYIELCNSMSPIQIMHIESSVREAHPEAYGDEFIELVMRRLKN
ncbi:hypothetical protein [Pseudoalteromonas galatheae]|uniref:hypothetical protein n=1 Tax=Pseudoalteromonas galatheae TaxID=579562 RepID=UPI0030CF91F2